MADLSGSGFMTNSNIDELFATTLAGDYDGDEPWEAVRSLRSDGSRVVFEKASEWCNSADPLKRARGCDVLSQLRTSQDTEHAAEGRASEPIFVIESFQIISRLLKQETDELPLMAEIYALGHLGQEVSIPLLVPYATDSRADIRYAVTHSLGKFPNDPLAIESLIRLADDPNDDIRNWSLFALGSQSDADSPYLRELFVRHLEDSHEDARHEAIAGLAKRRDTRAALPLLRLMESGSYYSHNYYDFLNLVTDQPESSDWGTEDFIDALYERYPDILPERKQPDELG